MVATDIDSEFCVVVDGVVYSLQRYGGLIRYWDQLLIELVRLDVSIELQLPERLRAHPPKVPRPLVRRSRVFHSTYFTRAAEDIPSVVTVHDCIYEASPEIVSRIDPDAQILTRKKQCIADARAIVVPSKATEAAVRTHYPAIAVPIHVVPEGVAPEFVHPAAPEAIRRARSLRRRAGSIRPYLLHVGGRAEYKDFLTVLAAFGQREVVESFDLVVVGSEYGPRRDEHQSLEALPSAAKVCWLGQVSTEELAALYTDAAALVSASTMEGFGLPVLEAVASGTPVACTRIPAYVETVGSVAEMFEAGDVHDCVRAIVAATNRGREPLRQQGQSLSATFAWPEMAICLTKIYAELAAEAG